MWLDDETGGAGGVEQPTPKEEVEEWRTMISDLTSQLATANQKIADLEAKGQPGLTPEMEALRDEVHSISAELQEAKGKLQVAETELVQMRQSRSAGDGNLTQETPKETSSAPTELKEPALTRASRIGWLR